jgi:glyoxylase-like metal-dependent hydrolase (beta-lactamase superfamily II)
MPPPATQWTPALWVQQSRLYHTNSGALINEGRAWLIDPGIFPVEIAAIARLPAAQGATVETIILTHSHWDHLLGPEYFPGVPVLAHAAYPDTVAAHGGTQMRAIAAWAARHRIQRRRPFRLPQPTTTFTAPTAYRLGDLTLRLDHAPGHWPDQLTIYDPTSGLLWAADMLSDREIPFVSHSLIAYRETLARLAGLDIGVLVPGHGTPVANRAEIAGRLAADSAYLAELQTRVSAAVGQGLTLDETVAACARMPYRERVANAGPHRWNVAGAYRELGGAVGPGPVGWELENV